MPDHVKPEISQTIEKCITEAIEGLRAFKARLSVANDICEIDIESVSHGIAVQDAISGMFDFSNASIDNSIGDLEQALKGVTS